MMLTCEAVNEFLAAYLDDSIPQHLRHRFEEHIDRCRVCRAYLDQYVDTIELTRDLTSLDPVPPEALVELTLQFLQEHWSPGRPERTTGR